MGSVGTTDRVTTLAGVPWSSKRIGNDTALNFPGDFDEAHHDDDTILAEEQDAQTGPVGDKILEELMHVNEQGQAEEAGPGSTVHIRHPSFSSTSDSSGGDSDSVQDESTGFPNARVEEQLNVHDGDNEQ